MPVAEAMAAGVPVACSDIEPLREVAGDAALLFTPAHEQAIAQALDRITGDEGLRTRLTAAGRRRAARFTWEEAACRTRAVLEEVVSAAHPRW